MLFQSVTPSWHSGISYKGRQASTTASGSGLRDILSLRFNFSPLRGLSAITKGKPHSRPEGRHPPSHLTLGGRRCSGLHFVLPWREATSLGSHSSCVIEPAFGTGWSKVLTLYSMENQGDFSLRTSPAHFCKQAGSEIP